MMHLCACCRDEYSDLICRICEQFICPYCWSKKYNCCEVCAEDLARDDHEDLKVMEALGK